MIDDAVAADTVTVNVGDEDRAPTNISLTGDVYSMGWERTPINPFKVACGNSSAPRGQSIAGAAVEAGQAGRLPTSEIPSAQFMEREATREVRKKHFCRIFFLLSTRTSLDHRRTPCVECQPKEGHDTFHDGRV